MKAIVLCAIVSLISVGGFYINTYIENSIANGVQKAVCEQNLHTQNIAIAQNALHQKALEEYKKELNERNERLVAKYRTLPPQDKSCQSQLQGVKDAYAIFFMHPS